MDIRGFLTCVGMFLCSPDGYNAIQHFRLWLQTRRTLKGAAA